MDYVAVKWVDSYHPKSGWQNLEEAEFHDPPIMTSVGWLYEQTEKRFVIIPHFYEGENGSVAKQYTGELVIPAQAVIEVQRLVLQG